MLNIQPVIPIEITEDWNVISRTILPVIGQDNIVGHSGSQFGIGDTVQSLFFSPKTPTANGWIWGAGPVFLIPTASDKLMGTDKWGAGPTSVMLRQEGPWTYGALANHIWSFAGNNNRADVSLTFLQPFVAYITETKTTFTLNTESTYDWNVNKWSVPVNATVSQLFKVGDQPMQLGLGVRYWPQSLDSGPEGWEVQGGLYYVISKVRERLNT